MVAEDYDVIVVGAGPAGSISARSSARKGARTLLLERDPVIGSPVRCGEAVAARNVERFLPLQDRWIAAKVSGAILYAPNGKGVEVSSPDTVGIILERNLFDRHLAELAAESGADVLTRADVDGLVINNGRTEGVSFTRFGKRQTLKAKVIIGADGVESRIGRWAGINTQLRAADLESAYQFYVAGIDYDSRYCHFYLGDKISPGGYVWVFPKGEKTASVGIGVCVRDCEAGDAYRLLKEFIQNHFGNASIVGEMAGGVPVSKPMKDPYRDGIILAGDAARHCNPLTGGGIATAMMAGFHAGEVAAEAALSGDVSMKALKVYGERLQDDVTKPNTRAYRLKEGVERLSDEMLNRTADDLLSLTPEDRTLKNAFLFGLKNQPLLAVDIIRAFV
jgi:digeranylgeranylglycerophospholipid reductase